MKTGHHEPIKNPGTLRPSTFLTFLFVGMVLVGIATFFMGLKTDPSKAWSSLLRGHFYFMGIALGGLFFTVIGWITTSMWHATVRRIAESFTAYLPFVVISTILVVVGAHDLFSWTHPEHVKGDLILEGKQGYLNMTFFTIRDLIAALGWVVFAKIIVGGSLSTDKGMSFKQVYEMNRKWGVGFLAFFAISFSMTAFDQLMSLDPHWFSTMFGVYCFAGIYQTFFATLAIVAILLKRTGYLKGIFNENHLHDVAKFMFAFTVFWAYTGFSQYMLIWYANLPEETGYFLLRFNSGWEFYTLSLFVGKFLIPFFLLLPRGNKRCEELVFLTAVWILVMQYMDLNWMIQPQFVAAGPMIGVTEIGVWLGFLGVFGLLVSRFLQKNDVVSMANPYLEDAVHHHHV